MEVNISLKDDKHMRRVAKQALEVVTNIEGAAPTEFGFGYTNESRQCREGLVIKKCAPIVTRTLMEKGYLLSMTEYGLLVDNFNIE